MGRLLATGTSARGNKIHGLRPYNYVIRSTLQPDKTKATSHTEGYTAYIISYLNRIARFVQVRFQITMPHQLAVYQADTRRMAGCTASGGRETLLKYDNKSGRRATRHAAG